VVVRLLAAHRLVRQALHKAAASVLVASGMPEALRVQAPLSAAHKVLALPVLDSRLAAAPKSRAMARAGRVPVWCS
jgi:hypothetical protein